MSDNEKYLEGLLRACQVVNKRQREEIEALRVVLDNINREHLISWEEFFGGTSNGNSVWPSDKIIKREA